MRLSRPSRRLFFIGLIVGAALGVGLNFLIRWAIVQFHWMTPPSARDSFTPVAGHAARAPATRPAHAPATPALSTSPSPPAPQTPVSPAAGATPSSSPSRVAIVGGSPRIAIIIDDCGNNLIAKGFIALPGAVTISVLPKLRYSGEVAKEAAAAGKCVILHLPMQPFANINPGPGTITVSMSDEEITKMVQEALASVPGAEGVNNHEGSRATSDTRVVDVVLAEVKRHGLFFIDSATAPTSVVPAEAAKLGVACGVRQVFLDNTDDPAYVTAQVRELVRVARRRGSAIGIGHCRPNTLKALEAVIPELASQGVTLAPARELVGAQ